MEFVLSKVGRVVQVLLTMHARLFEQLPFLQDKHPQFLEHLLLVLQVEFYAPNEHVLWQHDIASDMYFVAEGMLEIRVNVTQGRARSPGASPPASRMRGRLFAMSSRTLSRPPARLRAAWPRGGSG